MEPWQHMSDAECLEGRLPETGVAGVGRVAADRGGRGRGIEIGSVESLASLGATRWQNYLQRIGSLVGHLHADHLPTLAGADHQSPQSQCSPCPTVEAQQIVVTASGVQPHAAVDKRSMSHPDHQVSLVGNEVEAAVPVVLPQITEDGQTAR